MKFKLFINYKTIEWICSIVSYQMLYYSYRSEGKLRLISSIQRYILTCTVYGGITSDHLLHLTNVMLIRSVLILLSIMNKSISETRNFVISGKFFRYLNT